MKTIKLNSYGLGRYDDVSPFIIADKALELNVELPNVNGEFYLITNNNGTTAKKQLTRGESVELVNLSAGGLLVEIKHYLKGNLIKRYQIEPLILKEVDGNISVIPAIEALRRDSDERMSALEKKIEEMNFLQRETADKVEALIKFAYNDYQNNVYLEGGTVKKFAEEYGFGTEEEIKEIIGGKDND